MSDLTGTSSARPLQPDEPPLPPTIESTPTPTSGNGFKTIPYMQPEELEALLGYSTSTILYSAKKRGSNRKRG